MTENAGNLWLKQWLGHSLKLQLSGAEQQQQTLRDLAAIQPARPLIIGLSGAQGSGKSTLAFALQNLWSGLGIPTDVVSLDDYYLEPERRLKRAQLWHPLFAEHGVPGTHDSELLLAQLQQFRRGEPQSWRRYDKALDTAKKPSQKSAARLLILEGWCIGLAAQPEAELGGALNKLEQDSDPDQSWRRQVNSLLMADYQLIWQQLESLIWLDAPDWHAVCRWRQWQERPAQLLGQGKSPAELAHFMLYFQRLTVQSWLQLPAVADFILTLDQHHNFIRLTPDV